MSPGEPHHVLLIEDDDATARLIVAALSRAGLRVDRAADGREAAQLHTCCEFDAIVCDQHLPDTQGLVLLETWRRERPGLPTIILTADGRPELAAAVMTSGVDLFLYKDTDGAYVKLLPAYLEWVLAAHRSQLAAARALSELEAGQNMFTTIGDSAMDAIVVMDGEGRARYWNRAAQRMFGYSEQDILGRDVHQMLVPEELRAQAMHGLSRFLATGEGPVLNRLLRLTAQRKDGSIIPVELTVNALPRGNGWWAVSIIRDVSERERIEKQVHRQAEELAHKVKELSCMFELSRLLEDTDRPLPELLSAAATLISRPWRYAELACARIVLQDQVYVAGTFNETLWKIASPLFVGGRLAGAVEVCYSVEPPENAEEPFSSEERELLDTLAARLGRVIERTEADREIRELKRQMELVLGATRTGLYIINKARRIRYVDPATRSRYGDPGDEICFHYLHGRDHPCADCPIAAAERSGKAETTERTLPCEGDRPVQVTAIPFRDDQGCELFAAILVDLTARKAMEAQLAQAQKLEAVGRLAAGIAHEINTPVQYVSDNVRFLGEAFASLLDAVKEPTDPRQDGASTGVDEFQLFQSSGPAWEDRGDWEFLISEIPKAIEQSLHGLEQIAGIVRAMKEFAHQGARSSDRCTVDINRLIRSAITVCRNEWKYVADVQEDLDPQAGLLKCVPGELNQVLLNLIVNAAQAIAAKPFPDGCKGTIIVATRRNGDVLEISVADNGCGIPHEHQQKIFEPFFTTKEVGKGTGQGLAIARSIIVDHHQGSIDFSSQPGVGTVFRILLPAAPSANAVAPPVAAPNWSIGATCDVSG